MSFISDLFGGADNAAAAQIAAIQQGRQAAQGNIATGNQALTSNYTAGLQPFLQNYGQAQQGTQQLSNMLGLNGAAGNQQALTTLQTTPGYQYQLQQGTNAVNAQAAQGGMTNSGNQAIALQNLGQGLGGAAANNYINQLQPYLGAQQSAAGGIGSLYSGLGGGLNANQNNLANLNYGAATSIGNAQASADLANQSLGLNLLGGGISALTSLFSDERLKEDIEPVGELYDGTNIYRYRYKGDAVPRIGVMAQEVEKTHPESVHEIGGFKAVDYGAATGFAAELGKLFDMAA